MGRKSKKRRTRRQKLNRKSQPSPSSRPLPTPTSNLAHTIPEPTITSTPSHPLSLPERLLWYLFIFAIPTNLAVHFYQTQGHINGILVDYLLPKLYLSDILFLCLLVSSLIHWLLFSRRLPRLPTNSFAIIRTSLATWLLLTLVFTAFTAAKPIASFYYLAKLGQILLLVFWLRTKLTVSHLAWPLFFTALFQSLVGIFQWIQKSSILGYLFLGESDLSITSHIAKTAFSGEIRPLPYGTTPHPNVLAGFLVTALLIGLVHLTKSRPPSTHSRLFRVARFSLVSLALLTILTTLGLTQSFSAFFALIVGVILLAPRLNHSVRLLIVAIITSITLITIGSLDPDHPSISRRTSLNAIAVEMFSTSPLIGIGLNNFTARLPEFGSIPGSTRFIQPVHNIYLLWLSETGILGTMLLLAIILSRFGLSLWQLWQPFTVEKRVIRTLTKAHVPLIALLIIGLVDHYPLTLQTGLLLMGLSLGVTKPRSQP